MTTYVVFAILTFICAYPFYYLIINSISANDLSAAGEINWLPRGIHFGNYVDVFRLSGLGTAALVSLGRTVIGTICTVLASAYLGYMYTQEKMWRRKFWYRYMVITMYISAGLIPMFLTMKTLHALDRFQTVLDHYREGAQKGSPLDMVFLAYGPIVSSLSQIHTSYETCLRLMGRRFFCEESQHVLSYEDLRDPGGDPVRLTEDMAGKYERQLSELMKTGNRARVRSLLDELENTLRRSDADPAEIRTFLAGMFIHIRTTIANSYRSLDLDSIPVYRKVRV